MICNIIVLDKFFKHIEAQISGYILSTSLGIGIEINPMNKVITAVQRYPHLSVIGDNFEQLIIKRIFLKLFIELITSYRLIEKRELGIKKNHLVFIKGKHFILMRSEKYGIS